MARRILLFVFFFQTPPSLLYGHEGPPFPIFVDWKVDSMNITIWADPDVGTGTFFIAVEHPTQEELSISIDVQPISKKIDKRTYHAVLTEKKEIHRYFGEVDFPTQEDWTVDIKIGYQGKVQMKSVTLAVTPPGLGSSIDIVWYMIPFVFFGFFYILSALRPGGKLRKLFYS